ncbi:glycosyltransferase family 87 protein [Silicimonas sp. MF1-12-2]|uniref:glycosyltransferase family 87 protein n=1 Tax=Silicimonas sp. MF1-12-2 TaxID=3384793 RepID=UPI0039B56739
MSRPNPYLLIGALLVFIAGFGGLSVIQNGLFLDTHEGDTYHLLDILFRMEQGLQPHVDFVTPLGLLAFLPIVLLMQAGMGVGAAIVWSQVALALLLFPVVAYAAATRLPRRTAYAFGLFVLGLVMALTYGGPSSGASISMHYNRWAWALAFVMLVLGILAPQGRSREVLDGVLIGVLASALLLIKVTFFVCLVPAVAIALLWRGERRAFFAALVTGILAVLLVAVVYGPSHWLGYLADLRTVSSSDVRPFVGVPFNQIVAGPPFLGGTILGILAVFLLRQSGQTRAGTLLILLLPGFFYITYQNFGNDPKWLLFLPILLMTLRPRAGEVSVAGIDLSDGAALISAAALALFFPSLANLTLSPVNHAAIQSAEFLPMLSDRPDDQDIFIRVDRANTISAEVHLDATSPVWGKYREDANREPPLSIAGIELPHCELLAGSRAYFVEIANDLKRAGIPDGSQFFTTGILSAFWLFGPYAPLEGGAPWYYGGLSGVENADYVLVPKCGFVSRVQRIMLNDIEAAGLDLAVVRDNELYVLLAIADQ